MKTLYCYCAYMLIFCMSFAVLQAESHASGMVPLQNHSITTPKTAVPKTDEPVASRIITVVDDGGEFEVGTGQIIRVELSYQAGTGYLWHPDISDTTVLSLKSSRSVVKSDKGITGGPVLGVWYFEALAPGVIELRMLYYRDWEGPEKSAKEFGIRLHVVE